MKKGNNRHIIIIKRLFRLRLIKYAIIHIRDFAKANYYLK